MKIQFRIRGLNANANLRGGLEKQLERLHNLIPVSTAEVMLPPGTYQYAVVVDGRWMADPLAQESVPGLLSLFSILRVPVPDTPSDAESAEGDSMQGGIMHPRHNGHAPRKKQRR